MRHTPEGPFSPAEQFRTKIKHDLLAPHHAEPSANVRIGLKEKHALSLYQLARALHRRQRQNKGEEAPFGTREFDEPGLIKDVDVAAVSNEPALYQAFEYIKDLSGAGIGVGGDQMLDIAANTNLREVIICDINPSGIASTRALLEIGRQFHALLGRYPSVKDYLELLEEKNQLLTFQMIAPVLSAKEQALARKQFKGASFTKSDFQEGFIKGPPLVHLYLSIKAKEHGVNSWISNDANLEKIIHMYEEERIRLVHGDIAGRHSMAALARNLSDRNVPLSLFYLSNALSFLGESGVAQAGNWQKFFDNLARFPLNDQSVVLYSEKFKDPAEKPYGFSEDPYLDYLSKPQWSHIVHAASDFMQYRDYKDSGDPALFMKKYIKNLKDTQKGAVATPKKGIYLVGLSERA
ncbi:MAG: hypothetical protein Q8P56_04355 [Candidatus Uhrbacteria bacterium]|nr:hypothetical protein [Candidatus Uhrbacteria bacterium]